MMVKSSFLASHALRACLFVAAFAVTGCSDSTRGGEECATGTTSCGGTCVNLQSHGAHCGACGNACAGGQRCVAGACMGDSMCTGPGEVTCGGACVNPQTDPAHCGGCGVACGAGQSCVSGVCMSGGMDAGPPPADGGVIPGDCVPACDPMRSSSCDTMGGSTVPQCLCGAFGQCPPGQACVPNGGGHLCANLMFDPMNCGAVGNACAEGESCNGGVCTCAGGAACGDGQACCGSGCVDVQSDATNCGGCGMTCGTGETCSAGSCSCGGATCTPPTAGMFGIGADPGQSCCGGVCMDNNDTTCACEMCSGDQTCQVSGGGILPGMGGDVAVCCGGPEVAILGCGGGLPGI